MKITKIIFAILSILSTSAAFLFFYYKGEFLFGKQILGYPEILISITLCVLYVILITIINSIGYRIEIKELESKNKLIIKGKNELIELQDVAIIKLTDQKDQLATSLKEIENLHDSLKNKYANCVDAHSCDQNKINSLELHISELKRSYTILEDQLKRLEVKKKKTKGNSKK